MATITSDTNLKDVTFADSEAIVISTADTTCTIDTDVGFGAITKFPERLLPQQANSKFLFTGANIRLLSYDGGSLSAAPSMGDTCTGGTSGATGEVCWAEGAGTTTGTIKLRSVSGQFQDNETLTFTTPTGSAVANGIASTGSVTTPNAGGTTLIDSGATFQTDFIKVGDIVINDTDGSSAVVTSIDSQTQLTCEALTGGADNQWDSSDSYSFAADRRGWMLVVLEQDQDDQTTHGAAAIVWQGEWYDLGIGDGSASQTMSHYTTDFLPAVWVETGNGTNTYEIWLNTNTLTECGAGKLGYFFENSNSSATITFGDGTNGAVVPNGARVKVPNIHQACTTVAAWATNTRVIPSQPGLFHGINSSTGGTITFDKVIMGTYYMNLTNPTTLTMTDVAVHRTLNLDNPNTVTFSDVGVCAAESSMSNTSDSCAFSNVSTGTYTRFFAVNDSTSNALAFDACSNLTFNDCRFAVFNRGNTSDRAIQCRYSNDLTFSTLHATGQIWIEACSGVSLSTVTYTDQPDGVQSTSINYPAIYFNNNSTGCSLDGFSIDTDGCVPYDHMVELVRVDDIDIRNIGSTSTPIAANSHAESLFRLNDSCNNVRIARCYGDDAFRTQDPMVNTDYGVKFFNCKFDNSLEWQMAANNGQVRSVRASDGVLAGATGIEDDLQATAGTHFGDMFFSDTTGGLVLWCHSKTSETTSASSYTVNSGSPIFNNYDGVEMTTLGDQITWTWQWDILGHTAFRNAAMSFAGNNQTNHDFEYDIDTGSGYSGTWKDITYANLSGETISPSSGFRMKIRITCNTSSSSNKVSAIMIPTTTTLSDQQNNLHPLDVVDITMQNLEANSTYRIYNTTDATELTTGTSVAGGDVTEQFELASGKSLGFRIGGEQNILFTTSAVTTSTGASVYVSQIDDNFRTVSNSTALAYGGISVVGDTSVTISGDRSIQELYEYLMSWQQSQGNLEYSVPISTSDGATFILNTGSYTWEVTGSLIGSQDTLSGFTGSMVGTGGFFQDITKVIWEDSGSTFFASKVDHTFLQSGSDIEGVELAYLDENGSNLLYTEGLVNDEIESDSNGEVSGYAVYQINSDSYTGHTITSRQYAYENISLPQTVNGTAITSNVLMTTDSFITESDEETVGSYTGISLDYSAKTVTINEASWTLDKIYDYINYYEALEANLSTVAAISTSDGTTYGLTSDWHLIVDGDGNVSQDSKYLNFSGGGSLTVTSTGFYEDGNGAVWEAGGSVYYASSVTHTFQESSTPISGVELAYFDDNGSNMLYTTGLSNDEIESNGSGICTGYAVYKIDSTDFTGHEITARQYGYQNIALPQTVDGTPIESTIQITADGFITESTEETVGSYTGITLDYSAKTITIDESGWTLDKIYDYMNYYEALEANLDETASISTADGNTYNLASDWGLIVDGSGNVTQKTKYLSFSGTNGSLTTTSGGFFEDGNGAVWESSGSVYNAAHFYLNVKNINTNANIENAIIAFVETDSDTDVTFNTSLTNTGVTTDSNGSAEGYAVWKIDSTTYTGHNQYVGEYDYDWSTIPTTITGTPIGAEASPIVVRLIPDGEVTLTKANALAVSGITVNHSGSTADLSDETNSAAYDNLKARQARTNDIESGTPGYMSFHEEGLIIDYDGNFFNGLSDWTYQNLGGTGTWNNGSVELDTPGDIDLDFNTVTLIYTDGGTFDHRNEIMSGSITLVNTSGSAVTAQIDTGVNVNNVGPNITLDQSVAVTTTINSVDSSGASTNFATGTRIQVINLTGSGAGSWEASTPYSEGDVVLRTTGAGSENNIGLYFECTSAGSSDSGEPTWDTDVGDTTTDNTVTWTTRAIEMYNDTPGAVDNITINSTYITDNSIRYRIASVNGSTSATENVSGTGTITSTGLSINVVQEDWAAYATWLTEGAGVTEFSADYNNIQVDIDDADGGTTKKRLGAWLVYIQTTEQGINDFFGVITTPSAAEIKINTSIVDLKLDNVSGSELQFTDTNIRLYRDDFSQIIATNSDSIFLDYEGVPFISETGVSGLTSGESDTLTNIYSQVVSTDSIVDTINTNVGSVLTVVLDTNGSLGTIGGATDYTGSLNTIYNEILDVNGSLTTILNDTGSFAGIYTTLADYDGSFTAILNDTGSLSDIYSEIVDVNGSLTPITNLVGSNNTIYDTLLGYNGSFSVVYTEVVDINGSLTPITQLAGSNQEIYTTLIGYNGSFDDVSDTLGSTYSQTVTNESQIKNSQAIIISRRNILN